MIEEQDVVSTNILETLRPAVNSEIGISVAGLGMLRQIMLGREREVAVRKMASSEMEEIKKEAGVDEFKAFGVGVMLLTI